MTAISSLKIVPSWRRWNCRRYSSIWSGAKVRSVFLDYFSNLNHRIVPSSSVIPGKDDESLSFVNSGMNPFKSVILGHKRIENPRVADSQRCIRIAGKHNDLAEVGSDGSHHTFFEMLGSWSFNDYFKKEACTFAWELLTGPFNLPPHKLYVTYFSGDSQVPPDLETKEIWKSLGIDTNHILPKGSNDNFWEMGSTGPCGPCTEIHYNIEGKELLEIWNLVFMEYQRLLDGQLIPLKVKHVDTGMGLERLTSVLNNYRSNYDTDLFVPILDSISKLTGVHAYSGSFTHPMDTNYRILSDHIRMITVCLSDGLLPDSSHRLRNVIRRCFKILGEEGFHIPVENRTLILRDLSRVVVETLANGGYHKDLISSPILRESTLKTILDFEMETAKEIEKSGKTLFKKIQSQYPHINDTNKYDLDVSRLHYFYDGIKMTEKFFKENSKSSERVINGQFAFKLYDSLGLSEDEIEQLAKLNNATFDRVDFQMVLKKVKAKSKNSTATSSFSHDVLSKLINVEPTNDSFKYNYVKNGPTYGFHVISANIKQIVKLPKENIEDPSSRHDTLCPSNVQFLSHRDTGILILDRTTFYGEAGGQVGDVGFIVGSVQVPEDSVFRVQDTFLIEDKNVVCHFGVVERGSFGLDENVALKIDAKRRVMLMQNHTGSHLLNSALNLCFPLAYQRSLRIDESGFKFDANIFKFNVTVDEVNKVEEMVNQWISENHPVDSFSDYDLDSFMSKKTDMKVITIPGEIYPTKTTLVQLPKSAEPCCGTHVDVTGDVEALTITHIKSSSVGVKTFRCLTGEYAIKAREAGLTLLDNVGFLQERMEESEKGHSEEEKKSILSDILTLKNETRMAVIPYSVRVEVDKMLNELKEHIETQQDEEIQNEIERLMEDTSHLPYLVHEIFDTLNSGLKFYKVSRKLKNKCVFISVRGSSNNKIQIHASVPDHIMTPNFDALIWTQHVISNLDNVKVKRNKKNNKRSADFEFTVLNESGIKESTLTELATEFVQNRFHTRNNRSVETI